MVSQVQQADHLAGPAAEVEAETGAAELTQTGATELVIGRVVDRGRHDRHLAVIDPEVG
jgi:hypothetical protein